MKFIKTLPTYLLAFIYLLASLSFFYMVYSGVEMPMPTGLAGEFSHALMASGFMMIVKTIEVVCACMMLSKKTRALALVLIAPISVNVFLNDLLFMGMFFGAGLVVLVLNAIALYQHRDRYMSIIRN